MKQKVFCIITTLLLISLFVGCHLNFNKSESDEVDLGEMPNVKAETFNNIQVIDENFSKQYNYPITRFAIEYPDSVEVTLHEDEYSYINIKVRKDGEIIEELSIGNTTLNNQMKSKSTELLEKLVTQFEQEIKSFKTEFIGKSKFKDNLEYQFNGYTDYSAYSASGYNKKNFGKRKQRKTLKMQMHGTITIEQTETHTLLEKKQIL